MDAARWKQIDELVDAALGVSEEMRVNFVKIHAGNDHDLRDKVIDLLKANSAAGNFLNDSAIRVAARGIAQDETVVFAFAFINKTIGKYKVERLLGAGGMGEVYLAFDEILKRKVALKILPGEFISNDERVKRFEMEAHAISSLNHPGIVTIYDVGNYEGVNYIATEFVEGKTIRELVGGKFKLRNILSNSIQICDALAAAHNAGIIHRDIKPENIMIRSDGYAKVLDFGLAKLTDPGQQTLRDFAATTKGVIIGTPAYMSPSQISDERVDHRTDLWSCGVVLYEFLTGKNPFKGANRQETFEAILSRDPAAGSSLNPEIPAEIDRILSKLLEKDPEMGYQSAADLRADLKRVKREVDSSPSWSGNSRETAENAIPAGWDWTLPVAIVTAGLLVAFALYFLFLTEPLAAGSEWAFARNVQLTFQAGSEAFPSISPDGRSFVYVSDGSETGDNDDIFLLRIGGSNPVNLTPDSQSRDTMPAFSPDGELIAFRSERNPAGIYIMGATGENPRRVADFGYSPSWSPDGKHIVVATNHQPIPAVRTISSLWVINIESGDKRMLVDDYSMQPAWSPDGKRIAYWYTGNSGHRIVSTISAEGGEPIVFAETSNTNWNPVWSPDGKYLYYASDLSGNMSFWRARIDTETGQAIGEHEIVPTPAKFSRHLAFSADGKRMIYVQTTIRSNIRSARFDPENEKLVGEPIWVTRGDFEISSPELTSDGSRFFARIVRKTQDDIISVNADGSGMRDLTNDTPFDRYARLSPDDTQILFSSDRTGTYQVWVMNTDGTNARQLTFIENGVGSIPAWAPDGKRFSFDNEFTVFIAEIDQQVDLATAVALPKTENGGFFRAWDWSPDGSKLAGNFDTAHGPGVGYYSFETGRYERVADYLAIPRWLPDGRRLIFERNGRPMIAEIDTKKVREILPEIKDQIRNIAVSRDGKLIYYTTRERESDIWLLDRTETP